MGARLTRKVLRGYNDGREKALTEYGLKATLCVVRGFVRFYSA
jgi:hypothetical protein